MCYDFLHAVNYIIHKIQRTLIVFLKHVFKENPITERFWNFRRHSSNKTNVIQQRSDCLKLQRTSNEHKHAFYSNKQMQQKVTQNLSEYIAVTEGVVFICEWMLITSIILVTNVYNIFTSVKVCAINAQLKNKVEKLFCR